MTIYFYERVDIMYVQRNNLKRITIISLGVAIICFVAAILKHSLIFLLIASYLMVISLIADGLLLHLTFHKQSGILQIGRGIMFFLIITLLMIQLLRS